MTDYYVMLGLLRTASPGEIRAAYLARMKVLHPDCHAPSQAGAPSAADLNLAYWTLRDPARRAAYDYSLAPLPPRRGDARQARPPSKSVVRSARQARARKPGQRRSAYSPRARAVAALVFVALAAGAGAGTVALWRSNTGQASWASLPVAGAAARKEPARRRQLDEGMASAAAVEFEAILRGAGFSGASLYGRQCLEELAAQPSAELADYCLAFDRTAAEWEGTLVTERDARRYFDLQARRGRYERLLDALREGEVRRAVAAEAAFLSEP